MDWSMDADHNRSVIAFFGDADTVAAAMAHSSDEAVRLIDLNSHQGAHPRFGAVDVVPIVPLGSSTLQEAVTLSRTVGESLASALELPVYLYEQSASDEHRTNLASFRRLRRLGRGAMLIGDTGPDFGPNHFHPSAGAVAIGARGPLIAYNANLDTSDISIAGKIASDLRAMRERGDGMAGVKALAIYLGSRSLVQVSTNITRPDLCSVREVFEEVDRAARRAGTAILESELIGVASRIHLPPEDAAVMRFAGLRDTQFLEQWSQRYSPDCLA